jgi:TonB-linked SusC/RagA family outer membrane protein
MRKIMTIMIVALLSFSIVSAQTRLISGKVTDSKGAPVPGATVKTKSGAAVAADENGNFQINAQTGDFLTITSIDFGAATVKVGYGSTVDVTMEAKENKLEEVVVTALGIKRTRSSLAYAAQQITGDDVSKTRSSNFVSNLSGKISGLEIRQNNSLGGSTNVVIRGAKSLTGSNQALFVIDGVPVDNANTNTADQRTGRGGYDYGNAAADLNPDDIESINVLKGAASTALYGSRASNGAIIITTKKATKGLGITINTGASFGSIDKSTFAKYQKSYGGGYGQYYEDASGYFLNRDPNNGFSPIDPPGGALVDPMSEDASYGAPFDPTKLVYQWDAFDPSSPNFGKARPWVGAANDPVTYFEKPVSTNFSVMINGGSDKGLFKLGYTRNDEKGILPNSRIKKDLFNFSSSYKITEKLVASGSINFSKVDGLGRYGTGYDAKNPATNFRQWWQVNNDLSELKDAYFRTKKNVTWNWADPTDLTPIYCDNPYWDRYQNYESDGRSRYLGNIALTYKVSNSIDILGRVGLDSYDELQEERINVGSIDVSGYTKRNNSFREYNYDLLVNFNKNLSESLNLKAAVGSNIRRTSYNTSSAVTNGGLAVPDIFALSNTKNAIEAPIENATEIGVDGVFATATLGYKDMLFLDGSFRRDKSSTLPVKNNAYNYPAVSLGWVFSKSIKKDLPWLSYGKVRANYAEVGSSAPAHRLYDTYIINTSYGSASLTSSSLTKNNPDLKPERTKSAEVGIELQFFKNRLGIDASYYDTKTKDQIVPAPVSRATGYNAKYINAGEIENKGVEITLNGTPVRTRNFTWNINVNWTKNRNRVNDLGGEIDNLQLGSFQGGVTINAALGQPYGTIRGSNFVYTNGQRTVGANGRYLMSPTSNEVIGNTNPDWIGGINNSFKYKNFTLSFLIDVRQGGDLFSLDMYYGLATGLYAETAGLNDLGKPLRNTLADGGGIIREGVTADGKPNTKRVSATNFGAYGYRYSPAAGFVYDASYVKLREANLTYSFPQSFFAKIKAIKGIDFSVVGRNLWIIHKNLPYADPEEGVSSGNLQGYQVGAYPTTRSIGLNLKFRF